MTNYLLKRLTTYKLQADAFAGGSVWFIKDGVQDVYASAIAPGDDLTFGPYAEDARIAIRLEHGTVKIEQQNNSNPVPSPFEGGSSGDTDAIKTINGEEPDETGDIEILVIPAGGTVGQVLKRTADGYEWAADSNTTYTAMTQTEASTGTATTARTITAAVLKKTIDDAIAAAATP